MPKKDSIEHTHWNGTKKFEYSPPPLLTKSGCFSRIPYPSLIAFMMCFIGVLLFSVMMIWSFNASVEQIRRVLNITNIPWIDKIHILFFVCAFLMIVVAFALLLIGILSTGSTREEIYKRSSAQRGGLISCVVAITLSYFLIILWIFFVVITAILSFIYFICLRLCLSLSTYSEENCLDFRVFKPLITDISDSSLVLCSGNAQQFCALTNTVLIWYAVGFGSSVLVCLGLIQFIASNVSNYSHINGERRFSELQNIIFTELYSTNDTNLNSEKFSTNKMHKYPNDLMDNSQQRFYQTNNNSQKQNCFVPAQSFSYSTQPNPVRFTNESRDTLHNLQIKRNNECGMDLPFRNVNSVGRTINASRRNSYHNSLRNSGEYNNFTNNIY